MRYACYCRSDNNQHNAFLEGTTMRFIPTWIHGLLDYPLAVVFILLPFVLGFANGSIPMYVFVAAGIAMLVLSAMTAYEVGLVRMIPMPVHLGIDVALGLILVVAPWLFGFANTTWIPFVVLGLVEAGTALMTETQPSRRSLRGIV